MLPKRIVEQLKYCAKNKDLCKGARLHCDILKQGLLGTNLFVANSLITMYAKCGALNKAREVFHSLPVWNVVSWSTLIAGYAGEEGCSEAALNCLEWMYHEGCSPNAVTFVSILKACGSLGALNNGEQIHAELVKQGLLETNVVLGNALVDMYVKCGALPKAQQVLEGLSTRDAVTWTTLIAGYAEVEGHSEDALNSFEQMQQDGHSPNAVTFVCTLKACGNIGAFEKGKQIHAEVSKQGLLGTNIVVAGALVDMYTKCGPLAKAREVLEGLPVRNVCIWNTLIVRYAQEEGYGEEALNCFERMQHEGHSPDVVTFVCILKACATIGALAKGKQIHVEVKRQRLLRGNVVLGTALVCMYAKCRVLDEAKEVLENLPVRNVVTWNALMTAYAREEGHGEETLYCFDRMLREGHFPDAVTFISVLKACGNLEALDKGEKIHGEIVRKGLLQDDVVLGNALVDMYAKCGALAKSREVVECLCVRDIATWTVLIAGYIREEGHAEEALDCFERMQHDGHSPNSITFMYILKACGSLGMLEKGTQIHLEVARQELLQGNTVLGNAVVDMYAKCGTLARAQEVLEALSSRDAITWNTLIAGYAQLGDYEKVLDGLQQMQHDGYSLDAVTVCSMLNVCSHSGLVDYGEAYFQNITSLFDIEHELEHYNSMVDLFSRAGLFNKAVEVIKNVPSCYSSVCWDVLLGACQKWENLKLGRRAFDYGICLDKENASAYVCMSNMYAMRRFSPFLANNPSN